MFKTNQAVGGRGGGGEGVALEGVFWRWMVRNVYLYVQDEPGCWGKGRGGGGGSIGRSLLEVDGKKRLPLCSRRTRLFVVSLVDIRLFFISVFFLYLT